MPAVPSQPQSILTLWPVPSYTDWVISDRGTHVNNLLRVVLWKRNSQFLISDATDGCLEQNVALINHEHSVFHFYQVESFMLYVKQTIPDSLVLLQVQHRTHSVVQSTTCYVQTGLLPTWSPNLHTVSPPRLTTCANDSTVMLVTTITVILLQLFTFYKVTAILFAILEKYTVTSIYL